MASTPFNLWSRQIKSIGCNEARADDNKNPRPVGDPHTMAVTPYDVPGLLCALGLASSALSLTIRVFVQGRWLRGGRICNLRFDVW